MSGELFSTAPNVALRANRKAWCAARFDLIELNGDDLRPDPLDARRPLSQEVSMDEGRV
jgi:ATP-dependent DNA ligase